MRDGRLPGSKSGSGRWSHSEEIGWVQSQEIGWSHSQEIRGVQSQDHAPWRMILLMRSSGSCAVKRQIGMPARRQNAFTSHDPDPITASPRTRGHGRRA